MFFDESMEGGYGDSDTYRGARATPVLLQPIYTEGRADYPPARENTGLRFKFAVDWPDGRAPRRFRGRSRVRQLRL